MDRVKGNAAKVLDKSVRSGKILVDKAKSRPGSKDKLLLNSSLTITPRKACTKKEKIRQKHKNLMRKCNVIRKMCKEEIARKNRTKTAVVGDLKPLRDALPQLDALFQLRKNRTDLKTGLPPQTTTDNDKSTRLNVKDRFNAMKSKLMQNVITYEALLNDSEYRQNPRKLISEHIKIVHGMREE